MVIPVSAKQKLGIDDLLDGILLVADSMDIRANPQGKVIGTVIEAELDKSKGVMATLLVQNGTLESGSIVVAGTAHGKLRALSDFRGKPVKKAGPATPVAVMGLSDVPSAGDLFQIVVSEKEARIIVAQRLEAAKTQAQVKKKVSLEDLFANVQAGEAKGLNLIVKADVQGSLDPIVTELNKLGQGEIGIKILYSETGSIGDNYIMLASASHAIIIGFNVQADVSARRLAEKEGVDIRLYEIIYRMTEDIEKAGDGGSVRHLRIAREPERHRRHVRTGGAPADQHAAADLADDDRPPVLLRPGGGAVSAGDPGARAADDPARRDPRCGE